MQGAKGFDDLAVQPRPLGPASVGTLRSMCGVPRDALSLYTRRSGSRLASTISTVRALAQALATYSLFVAPGSRRSGARPICTPTQTKLIQFVRGVVCVYITKEK